MDARIERLEKKRGQRARAQTATYSGNIYSKVRALSMWKGRRVASSDRVWSAHHLSRERYPVHFIVLLDRDEKNQLLEQEL